MLEQLLIIRQIIDRPNNHARDREKNINKLMMGSYSGIIKIMLRCIVSVIVTTMVYEKVKIFF